MDVLSSEKQKKIVRKLKSRKRVNESNSIESHFLFFCFDLSMGSLRRWFLGDRKH